MKTLIIHATTYDFISFHTDQYILFDATIEKTGSMVNVPQGDYKVVNARGSLVMPGLVVGHTHIYSTFARGLSVPLNPNNFKEMLEQLWWKVDRNLTNDITYASGIVAASNFIKQGVTTIIDHHASGEIEGSLEQLRTAIVEKAKLRAALCFETSDRFNVDEAITENNQFLELPQTERQRGLLGLHASFSLSDETLKKVHETANGHPIHIHAAESAFDQQHCMDTYNMRVIERLDSHNLLTPKSIIAHAIHTNERELEILSERKVAIAVNITSNMNNGVGIPDIKAFRTHQIPVIVGNDGISQSITDEYLAIYFAMHHLYQSPIGFGMDDLQELIVSTFDYASSLFETKLGRIQEGYQSDLIILPYNPLTPMNESNILGHLVFGLFREWHPQHVFASGNHVLQDYSLQEALQNELHSVSSIPEILWERIKKED